MKSFVYSAFFAATVLASPTPTTPEEIFNKRDTAASSTITSPSQLESIVAGLEDDGEVLAAVASVLVNVVEAIVPSPAPSNIPAAIASVASVYAAHPTDFLVSAFDLILNGLAPQDLVEDALAESPPENSFNNLNPLPASPPVYPKKGANDALYSVSEQTLRGAIYIPPGFQYGKVPPVIFIPGTAATGGENFGSNFGKLFAGSDYADPVYLSIPGTQLNDIQVNAEYIAYAINYVSAISSHKNVSLLSWSAGSVGTAWAFTYWPSTRDIVSNDIVISADYHGTIMAYLLCPGFPQLPCAPSVIQQEYNSTFIATLRNAGGSSAYVPTTSVYSAVDEIVQPQQGTGASAYILDERQVGVSNTEVQATCSVFQPAGTLYFHEGVLYNPLAFALAKDALVNGGPGQLSRINVGDECQKIVPDGLSLEDVLATEATIPIAALYIETYPNKTLTEPAIMPYAQKDVPA